MPLVPNDYALANGYGLQNLKPRQERPLPTGDAKIKSLELVIASPELGKSLR